MNDQDKKKLTSKQVYLVKNLDFPNSDLGDTLIEESVISTEDLANIMGQNNKRNTFFLNQILPRRGPRAYEGFIRSLLRCDGQKFIAHDLDPELAARLSSVDSPDQAAEAAPVADSEDIIIEKLTNRESPTFTRSAFNAPLSAKANEAKTLIDRGEAYKLVRRTRGRALIINNKNFVDLQQNQHVRDGSDADVDDLEQLFKSLHFEVIKHEDCTAKGLLKVVKDEVELDHSNYDAFVLFIMSHGCRGNVYGVDCNKVEVDEIAECVGSCRTLFNKPKMLFFQACRQDVDSMDAATDGMQKLKTTDEVDSKPVGPLVQYKDLIVAFSTVPGFYSGRNTIIGSWFVRFFVYVCSTSAHKEDLYGILLKVNRLLDRHLKTQSSQTGELVSRLNQKIYFFPNYFSS